jgi:hypothetical protein
VSREVGLEVNTKKTKYMVTSHHQNAGQNHNLLITNKSFENFAKFEAWSLTLREEFRLRVLERTGAEENIWT